MLFAYNQTFCPPSNFWAGYAANCTDCNQC